MKIIGIFIIAVLFGSLQGQKNTLPEEVAELKALFNNMKGQLSDMTSAISTITDELEKVKHENEMLKHEISQVPTSVKNFVIDKLSGNNIGFTAYKTGGQKEVVAGNTIDFTQVIYNEGSAYDPAVSRFICSVSGFYFFHYSVFTERMHTNDQSLIALYKGHNGVQLVGTTSRKQGTEDIYVTASNSAYVYCEKDEPVWVRAMAEGVVCGENEGVRGSSFSGFFIGLSGE